MKKKSLLLIAFMLIATLMANSQTFTKGNGVLNLTIGLGNALYTGGGYSSAVPPLAVSYEVGVVDNVLDKGTIGIGGFFGYTSAKWDAGYLDYGYKYTNIVIGPRGTFHYPLVDKLDTYAGLMICYDIVSAKWNGSGSSSSYSASGSTVIIPFFIGARYYFNEKIAGVAELGSGFAYLNLGVSFKLK